MPLIIHRSLPSKTYRTNSVLFKIPEIPPTCQPSQQRRIIEPLPVNSLSPSAYNSCDTFSDNRYSEPALQTDVAGISGFLLPPTMRYGFAAFYERFSFFRPLHFCYCSTDHAVLIAEK